MTRQAIVLLLLYVSALLISDAFADELKKISAPAKKPALVLPNDPKQLDFLFDKSSDMKAWVRENGDLFIEGFIRHNHFRCGTYQLGIQFGKGDGCANVQWYSDPVYVSHKRQCNQAVLHHNGYQNDPNVVAKFDEITCAQLFIKCEGVCGTADIPTSSDRDSTGVLK